MLSIDGYRHHLGIIEHETHMYYVYKHDVCLTSVETSKQVLLDNFIKQERDIEFMQTVLRKNSYKLTQLQDALKEIRELAFDTYLPVKFTNQVVKIVEKALED
jgi:hypothetical protein